MSLGGPVGNNTYQLMRTNCCQSASASLLPRLTGSSPHVVNHAVGRHLPRPACQLQHFAFHPGNFILNSDWRRDHTTCSNLSSTVTVFRASSLPTDWIGNTNIGLRHAHCWPRRWWWWWRGGHCWDYLLFVLYTLYLTCNNLPTHTSMFSLHHKSQQHIYISDVVANID